MWYIDNIRDNIERNYGGDIRVRESMSFGYLKGRKHCYTDEGAMRMVFTLHQRSDFRWKDGPKSQHLQAGKSQGVCERMNQIGRRSSLEGDASGLRP